ncbi:unnamed protein product [Ilex paraguariensis]|uniref:F-box associated domain-containing protein n=1 Tax=Ilex paraguariensis TaxID=185542 RepID=A0ABC8TTP4_9AQUA
MHYACLSVSALACLLCTQKHLAQHRGKGAHTLGTLSRSPILSGMILLTNKLPSRLAQAARTTQAILCMDNRQLQLGCAPLLACLTPCLTKWAPNPLAASPNSESCEPLTLIVSFDLGEEVFHEIVLPEALAGEIATNLSTSVFRESLAVIKYDKEIGTTSCCVWVMKEYGVADSWTKLFSIHLVGTLEKIIGFRKNGEVLLSSRSCKLVAYDPKMGLIKDLEILGDTRSFHVDTYMETLVLLGKSKR